MRSRFWSSVALILLAAACGAAEPGPYDYDTQAPLAFRDAGVVNHDSGARSRSSRDAWQARELSLP
jgi:hypothetical protein